MLELCTHSVYRLRYITKINTLTRYERKQLDEIAHKRSLRAINSKINNILYLYRAILYLHN